MLVLQEKNVIKYNVDIGGSSVDVASSVTKCAVSFSIKCLFNDTLSAKVICHGHPNTYKSQRCPVGHF